MAGGLFFGFAVIIWSINRRFKNLNKDFHDWEMKQNKQPKNTTPPPPPPSPNPKRNSSKLVLLCCLLFIGCTHEPEFYIDGKPYYTKQRCVKDTTITEWEFHYGYSYRMKFEGHYGSNTKTECLQYVTDTIEIIP